MPGGLQFARTFRPAGCPMISIGRGDPAQARRKIQRVPGYRHRSKSRLLENGPAIAIRQLGLLPVPKYAKQQPAGSDAKHPTLLWEWPDYPTLGCYTGPVVNTLVIDVDEPEKFRHFVDQRNSPLFGDRWASLDGSLVSGHGDATPEGVRSGKDRGKFLFRFDGGPDHPLCRVSAKWKKSRGIEVFYGNGLPSILGQYGDNGDRYGLDGALGNAPDWLITELLPKERVRKPKVAAITPEAKQAALEGLPATLAELDARLGDLAIGWRRKDVADDREIWIGRCPFQHDSGRSDDGDLSAGFHDDGPYLRCLHSTCTETQEINRRLKLAYASKLPAASENGHVEALGAGSHVEPVTPVNQEALDSLLATYPRTDTGNAERLVARFGHGLRFCHPWKKWLVWILSRWKKDDTAAVNRMAKQTVRAMYREASCLSDPVDAEAHAKHKSSSEKRDRRNAMMDLAASEQGIPVLPDELDRHPWLFNCPNGTLDLRTGVLRTHNPGDLITQLCPVEYHPEATCPLWDQTLEKFLPDKEVREFFHRLCGYALTGVIRDHILPVCYGTGSNGKSTILGTLLEVFGADYAMKAPPWN